jgi:hypothetical protein
MGDATLTQGELAKKIGVSRNTLESWLADIDKPWSRQPGRFERMGILHVAGNVAQKRNPKMRQPSSPSS